MLKVNKFTLQNPRTPDLVKKSHYGYNIPKLIRPNTTVRQYKSQSKINNSNKKNKLKTNKMVEYFHTDLNFSLDKSSKLSYRKHIKIDFDDNFTNNNLSKSNSTQSLNQRNLLVNSSASNQTNLSDSKIFNNQSYDFSKDQVSNSNSELKNLINSSPSTIDKFDNKEVMDEGNNLGLWKLNFPKDGQQNLHTVAKVDSDFPKEFVLPSQCALDNRKLIHKKQVKMLLTYISQNRIQKKEELEQLSINFKGVNFNRNKQTVISILKDVHQQLDEQNQYDDQFSNSHSFRHLLKNLKEDNINL